MIWLKAVWSHAENEWNRSSNGIKDDLPITLEENYMLVHAPGNVL